MDRGHGRAAPSRWRWLRLPLPLLLPLLGPRGADCSGGPECEGEACHGERKHNYYRALAEVVGPTTTVTSTTSSSTNTTTTATTSTSTGTTSTTSSTTTTTTEGSEQHWALHAVCAYCLDAEATASAPDVWLAGERTLGACTGLGDAGGFPYITFKPRSGLCKLSRRCIAQRPYRCGSCTTEYGSCDLQDDVGYVFVKAEGVLLFDSPFVFDRTERTYSEAVLRCHALGCRIASIHSDAEQAQVLALITSAAYLGATSDIAGGWNWIDGTLWDYVGNGSALADRREARLALGTDGLWRVWEPAAAKIGVVCRDVAEVDWRAAYDGYFWDQLPEQRRLISTATGSKARGVVVIEHADGTKSGEGTYNKNMVELALASGRLLAGNYVPGVLGAADAIRWSYGAAGARWEKARPNRSCSFALSGHPDATYNGEYELQRTLINGQLWYRKVKPLRVLYFYDENSGGQRRWSLDYREQNGYNDWYAGGWSEGTVFPLGTWPFKDPADFYNRPERYLNIFCGGQAPVNFVKVKGAFNEVLDITRLDAMCVERGGRLASLLSAEEAAGAGAVCTDGDACYAGLQWQAGGWAWLDGSPYPSGSFPSFAPGQPNGTGAAEPCAAFWEAGGFHDVPCPTGLRTFRLSGRQTAGICKIVIIITTTTTTTTAMVIWAHIGADKSTCNAYDDGHDVADREACQLEAMALGYEYFSFSIVGGFGPTGALCATAEACDSPVVGTELPWKIFSKQLPVDRGTTATTTEDPTSRKVSALVGGACDLGGLAQIACRAVSRAKTICPQDRLEHIGMAVADCTNWMIANASTFRSIILVGPQWQRCLVDSFAAHPSTRFTTVDFCHPPELASANVACGTFQTALPNLDWGLQGYLPSYQPGVSYESKIDLITSVAINELARVRGL